MAVLHLAGRVSLAWMYEISLSLRAPSSATDSRAATENSMCEERMYFFAT